MRILKYSLVLLIFLQVAALPLMFGLPVTALEYDGFVYTVDGDTATITDYLGSVKDLVIPGVIDGKTVVAIGNDAFASTAIQSVTIPDSVLSIGNYAFSSCSQLVSVDFPARLNHLGKGAFLSCITLGYTGYSSVQIALPPGLTEVADSTFSNCFNLMDVRLPEGISRIGSGAFVNCRLFQINLPSTLTRIETQAFTNNKNLGRPSFPSSVTYIGRDAYYQNNWLDNAADEWIIVGQGQLLKYQGNATSLTLPANIRRICSRSMMSRSNLKTLYIPDQVSEIDYFALANTYLTSIRIPPATVKIDAEAFGFTNYPFTMQGYPGSYAETYATTNRIYTQITFVGLAKATFNSLGGSSVAAQEKVIGSLLAEPAPPTRTGHQFAGWYRSAVFSSRWSFASDTLASSTTLYAKWLLPVPSGLQASRSSSTRIDLSWNASSGVQGYEIYRSLALSGPYNLIKKQAGTAYSNTGLDKLTTYYYKILAYSTAGEVVFKSSQTQAVKVEPLAADLPTPSPTQPPPSLTPSPSSITTAAETLPASSTTSSTGTSPTTGLPTAESSAVLSPTPVTPQPEEKSPGLPAWVWPVNIAGLVTIIALLAVLLARKKRDSKI